MNEVKNPAALARATKGPPSRNASGARVSMTEASTAPPAKAKGRASRESQPADHHGRNEQRGRAGPQPDHLNAGLVLLTPAHCPGQGLREVAGEYGQ